MGKYIPVEPEKWAEMVKAMAEVTRLKAEVERLTKDLADEKSANANVEGRQNSANRGLSMENARLKAEVERLTVAADWKTPARKIQALEAEVERLRASSFVTAVPVEQYERLRKAGDAMQKRLIFLHDRWDSDEPNIESDAWNDAKEGKQP